MVGTESDTAYGAPPLSGAHTRRGVPARCDQPLYAEPHATTVTCQACGTQHDTRERSDAMRAELDDTLMTLAEAAWMITRFSDHRRSDVRNLLSTWAARRRITPAMTSRDGVAMYRYGELDAKVNQAYASKASA